MDDEKSVPVVWHAQQELILKQWSEQAMSYRYLHDRSYKNFSSLHVKFSLPVIILSTIAGTANFATGSFPEAWREYVSLATGGINLVAGMITTIAQFMKIPEMLEAHRASANDFGKLARKIKVELSLPIRERSVNGRDFIQNCRDEMEILMERAPDISLKHLRTFSGKFRKKNITMPDIIDLSKVEVYTDHEEVNRIEKQRKEAIEGAAKAMIEKEQKTQIQVSHVADNLQMFMNSIQRPSSSSSEVEIGSLRRHSTPNLLTAPIDIVVDSENKDD